MISRVAQLRSQARATSVTVIPLLGGGGMPCIFGRSQGLFDFRLCLVVCR
jgi:hypothetical protein